MSTPQKESNLLQKNLKDQINEDYKNIMGHFYGPKWEELHPEQKRVLYEMFRSGWIASAHYFHNLVSEELTDYFEKQEVKL